MHPQLPAKSVKELVALAKARPGQLNFPSAGNGSGGHLAGELFKAMTGADVTHVPYRGTGPAIVDLISGQMQFMFAGFAPVDPHVKSGRVRGIAVTSLKRATAAPQFPTVAETLPGFDIVGWCGLMAPAKTPQSVIDKLHAEVLRALLSREVGERLKSEGAEVVGNTPAEFTAFLKADLQRWAQVIKRTGAKID
jgi:tripartite-type tricarboxylate transporter receptor subunit TctC